MPYKVDFTIQGREPGLLMNGLDSMGLKFPEELKKRGVKDLKHWIEMEPENARRWDAESHSYRQTTTTDAPREKRPLVIPGHVLMACWRQACSGLKIKLGGKNVPMMRILPASIRISTLEAQVLDLKGKPRFDCTELKSMFVRIPPRTGARVLKTWFNVFPWKAEFTAETVAPECMPDQLEAFKTVLEHGGIYEGIMDGRPGLRRFNYGTFEITEWKITEQKARKSGLLSNAAGD